MAWIFRNPSSAPSGPAQPIVLTTVTSSTLAADNTTQTLLAPNASRLWMSISNGFNADTFNFSLYVKFGAGCSALSYTFLLAPGFTWESDTVIYRGIVTCLLASAGPNNVQATEGV